MATKRDRKAQNDFSRRDFIKKTSIGAGAAALDGLARCTAQGRIAGRNAAAEGAKG